MDQGPQTVPQTWTWFAGCRMTLILTLALEDIESALCWAPGRWCSPLFLLLNCMTPRRGAEKKFLLVSWEAFLYVGFWMTARKKALHSFLSM